MKVAPFAVWSVVLPAALVLAACAPDRTVDTLIPRDSLAVALVDQPRPVLAALMGPGGGAGDLPLKALDPDRPWAGAVLPASPPGFLLALPLAAEPGSWEALAAWARDRGGLTAQRAGGYAVLTTPGLEAPPVLDPDRRFDLDRVRRGGAPVALYLDIQNLADRADFPEALRPAFAALPWAEKNLAGLRLGLAADPSGLTWTLTTDGRSDSPVWKALKASRPAADPAPWAPWVGTGEGLGASVVLPPGWLAVTSRSWGPALAARGANLDALVGPRAALRWVPGAGAGWSALVESRDPDGVRQALKSLTASGDLQQQFAAWALDPDTPVVWRDRPRAGGGLESVLTFGDQKWFFTWGSDRFTLGQGAPAAEAPPGGSPSWTAGLPAAAGVWARGTFEGLAARGAVSVLGDGNVEVRVLVSAAEVKAWEERLPQALVTWLSGEGGLTRFEP